MHRLLRKRGMSGNRRPHASHPERKKPELLAAGLSEVRRRALREAEHRLC